MTEKKNSKIKTWLIPALVAALLVVATVVTILLLTAGTDPVKLYWNVDRKAVREPSAEGVYTILFACNGEQLELSVKDESLVKYIDTMEVMQLTLDREGYVTDAAPAENAFSLLGDRLYIQQITEDTLVLNPSITMSAEQMVIKLDENVKLCNVSGTGAFIGEAVNTEGLQPMDRVSVYAAPDGSQVSYVFVTKRQETSKVYWRTSRSYDSKTKGTKRKPDENGVYTVSFYCDGETVDLQFKDKTVVDAVDYVAADVCHFGFSFDEEGYATKILLSNIASLSLLQCENYDIQEINEDGSYLAAEMLKPTGKTGRGVITDKCAIYDLSAVAKAEGAKNRKVDMVKKHDRVCIWTDTVGNPVLIYILDRRADSPAYYNPDPQYDTAAKATTRTPDAEGYYAIELLKAGDTQLQTYYTKDIKLINEIDKSSDLCVGLKVGEGNVIETVYDLESVFGNTYFCRGYTVTNITGATVAFKKGSTKYGVLAEDCKVWNVSDTGIFGEETTLRLGDYVYAAKQPSTEIINIYVLKRAQENEK